MTPVPKGAVRVTFPNCRGQTLVGWLHGEPGDVAVISCHGMLSTKDGAKHERLAGELTARGMPVLRFDFAGRGESDGDIFDLSYSNEMEDLDAAIEYLWSQGVERIGLFGSSMGGAVALMAAARDERVVVIATLAAVGHPDAIEDRYGEQARDWQRDGYIDTEAGRIGKAFLDDAKQHNLIGSVRVLRAPVLVLHGDRDEVVPCSDAHDIAVAARNVALEVVLGADHRFSDEVHLRPAMTQIAEFLSAHLGRS